jgi:hypothetical protein
LSQKQANKALEQREEDGMLDLDKERRKTEQKYLRFTEVDFIITSHKSPPFLYLSLSTPKAPKKMIQNPQTQA